MAAILNNEKKYYDVRIECMVPATLTYRVFAENFDEAIELTKRQQPIHYKYKVTEKKDIKISIYDAGTSLIKFVKNMIR